MSLIKTLMEHRKSELTEITRLGDKIHYHYPRKHWKRSSSMDASRPLEDHLKTLEWVEKNAKGEK
jgi:hypothetical protein